MTTNYARPEDFVPAGQKPAQQRRCAQQQRNGTNAAA